MSKFKNKRLHMSALDVVFLIVFLAVSLCTGYFIKNCRETKELFNIENTFVDYTITAPSEEQIQEMNSRADIEHVTPYVFKTVDCSTDKKSVRSNLFILKNADDIKYTSFSEELLVKADSQKYKNPIYVSSDFAYTAKVSLGDSVSIKIQDVAISFNVQAIYESDHRYVGGTVMALLQGDVASAVGTEYAISGAYIDSNDLSMTNAYIDNYVPMGDLRGRDEFENDEMYQIYLEDRESTDFTKTTFYTERYLDELHNRKDSQLIREFLLAIAVITIGLIAVIVFLGLKARLYIKKDVVKDVRNNYSIEQETKMFNGYFVKNLMCYMLICVVSAFVSMLLFGNQLISAVTIGVLIAVFVAILLVKTANIGKLKREFATKVKEKNREG